MPAGELFDCGEKVRPGSDAEHGEARRNTEARVEDIGDFLPKHRAGVAIGFKFVFSQE